MLSLHQSFANEHAAESEMVGEARDFGKWDTKKKSLKIKMITRKEEWK